MILETVRIKDVDLDREYDDYVKLEMAVHGGNELDVWPDRSMRKALDCDGSLKGAYNSEGRLVGIDFCITTLLDGQPVMMSQSLAIDDQYRSQGIGYRLRLAQRTHALSRNIPTIIWPFDPLNSHNAVLYVGKLGAIVYIYRPRYFGETKYVFQAGIDTDRVYAEWSLSSDHVNARIASRQGLPRRATDVPIVMSITNDQPYSLPKSHAKVPSFSNVYIEIPPNFRPMIREDPERARMWRNAIRNLLMDYLRGNFAIADIHVDEDANGQRHFYYYLTKGLDSDGVTKVLQLRDDVP